MRHDNWGEGLPGDSGEQVVVSLKIDVDTLQGYVQGVPRLLRVLDRHQLAATFCIAMGPDCSGRAVRRVLTHRGFVSKMLRTRALRTYSWRTLLYGTLLPAPQIVARRPQIIKMLLDAGYEVIPHGWDHVAWHDSLRRWDMEQTRKHLQRACRAFEEHAGRRCHAFAAPGWQATANSLLAEQELGLRYAADTRGYRPFFPVVRRGEDSPEQVVAVLQIPTTLPTLDELINRADLRGTDLLAYVLQLFARPPAAGYSVPPSSRCRNAGGDDPGTAASPAAAAGGPTIHVFTAHAEIEGGSHIEWFDKLLAGLRAGGVKFVTLQELADLVTKTGRVGAAYVADCSLPGRAGTVTCQQQFIGA